MLKQKDDLYSPENCGKNQEEEFCRMMLDETEVVRPIIKEQLLKEYIFGNGANDEVFNIYCKMFDVDKATRTRMLIIYPEEKCENDDLFFYKNIVEQCIDGEHLILNTIIKDYILVVTDISVCADILMKIDKIRRLIKSCYKNDAIMLYSREAELSDAPEEFSKIEKCLDYAFYASDAKILYADDINTAEGSAGLEPQYAQIEKEVKNSNYEKAAEMTEKFFDELEIAAVPPAVAKTYCLELYVCIIRCCEVDKISEFMKGIVPIQEKRYLSDIRAFILEKMKEIISMNAPQKNIYSSLVREALMVIEENISNENLSLRWIAGSVLYTNVDYLGKLFKKETGKNFSHYVMEKRMEMAKEMILSGSKDRIYEIAENVGYGLNPQYFSQVFKKYTGYSPLEYRDYARKQA
ncbi:MAG: helix-turn-helix domain-containing protein [Firmicutes bacterium]|nr:helix-turn-helix domain-containing protein [Bacillota bacterium]